MPICPSCKTFFPPGVPSCPKDGTSLSSQSTPKLPLPGQAVKNNALPPAETLKLSLPLPASIRPLADNAPKSATTDENVASPVEQHEDDHTPNEEPLSSTMRMEALE